MVDEAADGGREAVAVLGPTPNASSIERPAPETDGDPEDGNGGPISEVVEPEAVHLPRPKADADRLSDAGASDAVGQLDGMIDASLPNPIRPGEPGCEPPDERPPPPDASVNGDTGETPIDDAQPPPSPAVPGTDVPLVFSDVGAQAGIGPYWMAVGPRAGVSAEDYDQDGFVDLFVPTGEGTPDHLYRNLGDGTFADIAPEVDLDSRVKHRTALWFDYDDDEDLDLVVASDCRSLRQGGGDPCPSPQNLWLYAQGADGKFRDVTSAAGLHVAWGGDNSQHRGGMAAGDIDDDGDLDLVVPGWNMSALVFRNEGDGTFSDATSAVGLPEDEVAYYQRAVLHDFDDDGFTDLYLTVDIFQPDTLYLNAGDGSFRDVASAVGVDNLSTDMGVTIGDYDNDGDFDFYVTVITQEQDSNRLYRNDASDAGLIYANVAPSLGVENGGWGWGATFFDADNDGWLDLATTNGSTIAGSFRFDVSRFWQNPGPSGGEFLDLSSDVGFDDVDVASGLLAFDYDADGDLDLLQAVNDGGPLRLLRNDRQRGAADNGFLVIRPRQDGANHWAIGAKVEIRTGELRQIRPILAGISTDSQEPAEAFFGLGAASAVDEVTITWPGSARATTVLTDVAVNQVLTVSRE
jgi:hypothetical protein